GDIRVHPRRIIDSRPPNPHVPIHSHPPPVSCVFVFFVNFVVVSSSPHLCTRIASTATGRSITYGNCNRKLPSGNRGGSANCFPSKLISTRECAKSSASRSTAGTVNR